MFAARRSVNVKAELFDDSHVLRVTCSDSPQSVEVAFNDFVIALKNMRTTVGVVTLVPHHYSGGDLLERRVKGLANVLAFPVVVERNEVVS